MSERLASLLLDSYRTRKGGPAAIQRRRRTRLAEMVAFARANSPFYRELYRGLPPRVDEPARLPVTNKQALMSRFDDWVTDREVTHEKARAFVDDPTLVGLRFLGRYLVNVTSGSTGTRGIFVLDDRSITAGTAVSVCMFASWLSVVEAARILAGGCRVALVGALGGHFSGATGYAAMRKDSAWRAKVIQGLSAQAPLPDLVTRLNRFRPAVLTGYASVINLLAGEQEAGRMQINPVLVCPTSEGLSDHEYNRIAALFQAKVRVPYGATESLPPMAEGCSYHWMHLNSDWCLLEPVDADFQAVPPGVRSHTVLLSNLANRVQPILRYDLGDSVLARPDPCPCGNPVPAIRVQGRVADVLTFPAQHGDPITIPPLAFTTLADSTPGIELFQVVQTNPTNLRVHLLPADHADPDTVWQAIRARLTNLLCDRGLDHVTIERSDLPPRRSAGGKHLPVIPVRRSPPE